MSKTVHYRSKKLGFTIHRPSTFRPVIFQGQVANEKVNPEPIEFRNGRFATDDPEVIEILDNHPGYKRGDFMKVEDVTKQVHAAGLDEEPEDPAQPSGLELVPNVKNRNQAIQELVERGVDPDTFDRTTTKEAIIDIARENGVEFVGY